MKLQDMRNPRKLRWPLYFFFGLIIVSFIFFYGWQGPTDRDRQAAYARMRSESISPFDQWVVIRDTHMAEAKRRVLQEKAGLLPSYIAEMLQRQGMLQQAIDPMITVEEVAREAANVVLLERAASRLGIVVPRQEIIDMLNDIPGLTNRQLAESARAMGLAGPEELVQLEQDRRRQERARSVKSLAAHASLFELWQEYSIANDQLTLELAAYPADRFAERVVVDEQELQEYFEQERERFRIPQQRRYHFIKVEREQIGAAVEPTPEQVQNHYEQNQANYRRPEALRVEELYVPAFGDVSTSQALALIEEARTSATAAQDWPAVAERDDLLFHRVTPWLEGPTSLEYPFDYWQRVQSLQEDQVSTPIVYRIGFGDEATTNVTLARVIERRPEGVPPLSEIEDRVRADYVSQETQRLFDERVGEVREASRAVRAEGGNITQLAERLGVDDSITTMVERYETFIPELGSLHEYEDYVASLREGELSDALPTEDAIVVLQPTDTVDARYPELDEVREQVLAELRAQRSGDLARAAAESALRLIQDGAPFEDALAEAPVGIVRTDPIRRTEPVEVLQSPLIDFTEQTLRIDQGSVGMSPYGQDPADPAGFAVWRLVLLQPATVDQFAEDRYAFTRDYLQLQRAIIVREWLRDEREQADFQLTTDAAE